MKKHAIGKGRAAAEPRSARRSSERFRDDVPEPVRRRPRRHDDPFREPDADDPKGPRHGPARHDRRSSRHQLRSLEGGWGDAEPEDEGLEDA